VTRGAVSQWWSKQRPSSPRIRLEQTSKRLNLNVDLYVICVNYQCMRPAGPHEIDLVVVKKQRPANKYKV
jgi:hypothetical protein